MYAFACVCPYSLLLELAPPACLLQSLPEALASIAGGKQQQTWFPDRQSISKAALDGCLCIPEGAQSLLIQPVGAGNNRPLIIAMSERPRCAVYLKLGMLCMHML